ncbi:MAG: transcriptional activator NhaR [Pseudomonadota bacterium]|nr:transcriptional activator NhaR [Pseudomonadota bacterium]
MSVPAWLNYHHLLYFHATAREGSMTAAAKKLRLAQPTLSGQIKQLEDALGEPLFERRGRRLELTATGRTVYHYAEEIFGLGQELLQAVRGRPSGRPLRFAVGVSDALPKLVVYRLLAPVFGLEGGARLDVRDGDVPALLSELGAHRLDLVLSDAPLPSGSGILAYSHALGECGVTFFAQPSVAAALSPTFPQSLDGARMLLPAPGSALRRGLDEWLDRLGLSPDIVGEVGDSALLEAFGRGGAGVFAAPTAVAPEVAVQHDVVALGATEDVRERFWAISAERRIRHPAVGAVVAGARALFP